MSSLLVDIDRLATYDAEGVAPYIIGKKEISTSPYTFRQGLGTMADMDIIGGTVVWNQLVYTNDSGTLEMDGTRTRNVGVNSKYPIVGHVYYISANILSDTTVDGLFFEYGRSMPLGKGTGRKGRIYKAENNKLFYIYMFIAVNEVSGVSLTYEKVKLFDLTLMFGSTIADYIYSLEQANEGDGVAWFRKYFPKDYYAYDPGSLQSVRVSERMIVGKNLLDASQIVQGSINSSGSDIDTTTRLRSPFIQTMPNASYAFSSGNTILPFEVNQYDSAKTWINHISLSGTSSSVVLGDNTHYIKVLYRKTNNSAILPSEMPYPQVELGSTATVYEPYTSTVYPFDSTKELRGLFSLSGNELIANGDVYTAGGNIQRKYGIVDLGTLTYTYWSEKNCFDVTLTGLKDFTRETIANMICSKYPTAQSTSYSYWNDNPDKTIFESTSETSKLVIKDSSYTDAATFKTAMSGVYLVYELETPTTESSKPFQNPQRAYPDGTEEFTDGLTRDVMVPVGNKTTYQLSKALIPSEDYTDGAVEILEDDIETKADILAIAPNEPGTTASQAYSTGDHFYKDGKFCTAITSISSGATFTKNTNYREEDGGATSAMNNYRSKKLTATVSSTSLAFTDTLISNSATIIDGPYIADIMVGVTAATISNNTVTFTLDSSSANGKSAYIWLRY